MFSNLFDPLTSLIYPQFCTACGEMVEHAADGPACAACWAATTIYSDNDNFCRKCGEPSPAQNALGAECGLCGDFEFETARAAGVYESALKAVVLRLKSEPHLCATARRHFFSAFDRLELSGDTMIIPVPVSQARRVERGFNQAELLAKALSTHAGLPVDANSLVRKTHTLMHRAAMDRKARQATVKNAFEVVRPKLIAGRDVLLVDDLFTSGATASHCARTLKKNGAGKVIVLTLARAVLI